MDDASAQKFTALFDRYYVVLVKQCLMTVGFDSEYTSIAEDCVQYAFLQALLNHEKVLAYQNPAGWLYATSQKKLLSEIKKKKRRLAIENKYHHSLLPACAAASDHVALWHRRESIHQLLNRILAMFSLTERRVCWLYLAQGYSLSETAAIMHVDSVVVRGAVDRIHRKARKLQKQLGQTE